MPASKPSTTLRLIWRRASSTGCGILERLREYVESNTLCGRFQDGNPFISSVVLTASVYYNPGAEDDQGVASMVRRNEVWFAGFESPQTAFLLRGSTHHLLGATPKTQAPLISTRSMLFNFDTYTSKIWDSLASAPEKIRVEILAVRHQVLALTRLRSIPGTDEAEIPGFSIVTGSPIYVYCLERIDPTSSLTRELAAFASADAKVGAAEKSVRNQRPMPPIFA